MHQLLAVATGKVNWRLSVAAALVFTGHCCSKDPDNGQVEEWPVGEGGQDKVTMLVAGWFRIVGKNGVCQAHAGRYLTSTSIKANWEASCRVVETSKSPQVGSGAKGNREGTPRR